MRYLTAVSATVVYSDDGRVQVEGPAAESLYLSRYGNRRDNNKKFLRVLCGQNEFERGSQKRVIDWLESQERPGRKRILLIGDSIRMRIKDCTGYGLHAYRRLAGEFNITHIPHNCGGTKSARPFLDDWLSCKPDIVHINMGLHDLSFNPTGGPAPTMHTSIQEYALNLEMIAETLQNSTASVVVWASSTPVHDEWIRLKPPGKDGRKTGRELKDVIEYNKTADEVMKKFGIQTHDLFDPVMKAGLEECLLEDGVHLSHCGSSILGKVVAERLSRYK